MQVNSYVFKSPYPSPVQTGQPDPLAKQEQESFDATTKELNEPKDETTQEAKAYSYEAKKGLSSTGVSTLDSTHSLQSSLDRFSAVNAQVKAQLAYSA